MQSEGQEGSGQRGHQGLKVCSIDRKRVASVRSESLGGTNGSSARFTIEMPLMLDLLDEDWEP